MVKNTGKCKCYVFRVKFCETTGVWSAWVRDKRYGSQVYKVEAYSLEEVERLLRHKYGTGGCLYISRAILLHVYKSSLSIVGAKTLHDVIKKAVNRRTDFRYGYGKERKER